MLEVQTFIFQNLTNHLKLSNMPQRTTFKEQLKSKVKTFISETGVSISQIANDESVNYSNTVKIKDYIFHNKGTMTIEVADRIMNFIENYKPKK